MKLTVNILLSLSNPIINIKRDFRMFQSPVNYHDNIGLLWLCVFIPDLLSSRNITFDQEKRKELSNFALDVFFNLNFNSKYQEIIDYKGEEKYSNWYEGTSKISLPYKVGLVKNYDLNTTAVSGSFTTPSSPTTSGVFK